MILKSLEPLLSRMKVPQEDDDIYEAERRRQIAPTIIKLIEAGGIGEALIRKFKKDGELNQELLEEFVIQIAIEINGPSQEERKVSWEEFINEEFKKIGKNFEEIYFKLVEIDKMCVYGLPKVCKGAKSSKKKSKEIQKVFDVWMNGMPNLKKIYLSKLDPPIRPDVVDRLINAFRSYRPEVAKDLPFMGAQIKKMLKPFGINYNARSVEMRARRNEKEGVWFLLKISGKE